MALVQSTKRLTPVILTSIRALLAPIVVLLSLYAPWPKAFAVCLIVAFLSDIFDGVLARRFGVATANLRRLDSAADSFFYIACVFAVWHLHPSIIREHFLSLGILATLEITRYAFDLVKFKQEASYHMWSSKLWGIALFTGFFSLLVFGLTGLAVTCAIWIGVFADLEGLAISILLARPEVDVPTFVHALRMRRNMNT